MSRRKLPSLSAVRAFEAFARLGTMSGAGEELGVTHGAVSRQVKTLEAQVGASLIQGPRHQLRLTKAGCELAAAATNALDLIATALPGGGAADELVIDCLGTFAMKWLIPRLRGFHADNPDVRVRLIASHAPASFDGRDVHAAIRIMNGPAPPGIRSAAFLPHHQGLVIAPSLWREIGAKRERLLELPRLHSATFLPAWSQWSELAGVALPPASTDREYERFAYMLEACAAGLGVGVVPWAFAAADVESGRLAAPFGFARLQERYVFLRPKLGSHSAADRMERWLQAEGRRMNEPPAAFVRV